MAHKIGAMFYCDEVPWHGLGRQLDEPATVGEALLAGELNWTVSMVPITLLDEPESPITQRMAVVRDDRRAGEPGRVLGVVHPNFRPLQNEDGARIFDGLLGAGQRIFHTGGYLREGEIVWLLAKLPEPIRLPGNDVLDTYLLFSNSHDGSLAIDIRLTTVRVVCNNTLSLALSGPHRGKAYRRGHSGSFELVRAEAQGFFQGVLKQQAKTEEAMTMLSRAACEDAAFTRFLEALLPIPARPATADTNLSVRKAFETRRQNIVDDRQAIEGLRRHGAAPHLFGRPIPPAPPTWWGALNSITAWVDHVQEVDGDRYAHVLFGGGDQLKTDAYRRIVAMAAPT